MPSAPSAAPRTRSRPARSRARWAAAPWLAAALLGTAAALRLASILPLVDNREAFGWDSARRAVLNARAGDALRGGHLLDWVGDVVGPETWPTLRLVPASILHAIAGPAHAFAVEHALSIATIGALALAVAWAARALSTDALGATAVTLVATALLAGNVALLAHAANGMLEPLSAAVTTAAVAAWIEARSRGRARPWALAVAANLVFHTKWQHGLLLAAAVVLLEGLDAAEHRPARDGLVAAVRALAGAARTRLGAALLGLATALGALAAVVASTGGGGIVLAGVPIGLRTVHGPIAWGALAAFLFVEVAFWRAREGLREAVPARLRFAWAWVATPMAAWLLVPGTWRLRTTLVTSATYDSGEALASGWARLAFYPEAAWRSWTSTAAHPVLVALALATAAAAWRSALLRRRLLPVVTLVALEWVALTLGTRHNFQARFALNLAPLVAVSLAAWTAALPARWAVAGGAAALIAVSVPSAGVWSRPGLVAVVGEGFDPADHARDCRALLERLPVERLPLVNHAPLSHRQGCALWATVIARARGEDRHGDGTIVLTGSADPAPDLPGLRPDGAPIVAGPLRGGVYVKAR